MIRFAANAWLPFLIAAVLLNGCRSESAREGQNKQQLQRQRQTEAIVFDSEVWKAGARNGSGERVAMLEDLMSIDSLRYVSEERLIEILGNPYKRTQGHLYYRVQATKLVTWTLHAKTLVVVLGGDSARHKMLIHE